MADILTKINDIPIGGKIADGQWVNKDILVFRGYPDVTDNYTQTFSLEDYLPDDEYVYEVIVSGYAYTARLLRGAVQLKVISGSSDTNKVILLTAVNSDTQFTAENCGLGVIPIFPDDRNLTLYLQGYGTAGESDLQSSVRLFGYRRLGTNGSADNYIEKIKLPANELLIGGNNFDGQWISSGWVKIAEYNYTSGNTYVFNLKESGLIPNDNYAYEIMISAWAATGTTAGDYAIMDISSSFITDYAPMTASVTKTNNVKNDCWRSVVFPIGSDGILNIQNRATSGKSAACAIFIGGYRRIGTNLDS